MKLYCSVRVVSSCCGFIAVVVVVAAVFYWCEILCWCFYTTVLGFSFNREVTLFPVQGLQMKISS